MSVQQHYDSHLGPVYAWSVGGVDAALDRGEAELAAIDAVPSGSRVAVDLGAGFGMHAIPLAQRGYRVLAIDSCASLLRELEALAESRSGASLPGSPGTAAGALPITCIEDDLLGFASHVEEPPELILCMGDTIQHLSDPDAVVSLIESAAKLLATGGRLVLTFRDYSVAREGAARFIPVRSDDDRILTCFLEYADASLTVHDLLYERSDDGWSLRVSAYAKLRLPPSWVILRMEECGLTVRTGAGLFGMVRIEGKRSRRRRQV